MTSLDDRLNALDDAQRERLRSRLQALSAGHGHGAPRFSLFFFAAAHGRDARRQYELMTDCARFADENGFEAIWVPERHFDPFGAPYPSPSVLAAALAATTKRLQIRAGSVVLPLHDPIRVAEDWAVIDNLSGGRAAIALASGWHPNDFVFAPDAFDKRKQVLVEHMKTVRTLFAGEEISRTDGSGHEITLRTYPRPVQAQIPMWITSTSSVQTWQTGAEHGLNVLTGLVDQSLEDLQQNAAVYRDCLREVGRDPGSYSITAMVHTFIGKPGDDVREIVREPMTDYLRAHLNLYAKFARTQDLNIDVDTITDADRDALARFGFERYYKSHGLFGSPEQALPMVRRMAAAGVDEIACLVDFGLPAEIVLSHLGDLARLQALAKAELP
jgi:natural product biosynthesis luciferase-like monooxygenase protein